MQFSDLKLGARLSLSFAVVLLLLGVVAGVGWSALASNKAQIEVITGENNVKMASANAMRDQLNIIARAVRNLILYDAPEMNAKQKKRILDARQAYEEKSKTLQSLLRHDVAKKIFADIEASGAATQSEIDQIIALDEAGKTKDAAEHLRDKAQTPQDQWFAALQAMIELQEKQNAESVAQMNVEFTHAKQLLSGVALAAVLLGVWLAWLVTRSITRPINDAVALAQRVAASDLSSTLEVKSRDETGLLIQALKDMQSSLTRVVGSVRQNSESVATASAQIAQGNQELSQRTEEQASALEETAASMEQLSSTVRQNADHARQANQLAMQASVVAVQGGEVVSQVVETMKGINDSSRKISYIIQVIDGIAFQTNILALNAAVEAARAGDQGRGFAVVASEVRSLAGRSAEAAKEIKFLINASVERVEQGTALVDQAGATMAEVVSSIRRVTDIMGEISAASAEQSAGVSQIGEAVTQMDQVTQQNAALVEEMAAAASSLTAQAQDLVGAVAVFTLAPGDERTFSTRTARAPSVRPRPTLAPPPLKRIAAPASVRKLGGTSLRTTPVARTPKALTTATLHPKAKGADDWANF